MLMLMHIRTTRRILCRRHLVQKSAFFTERVGCACVHTIVAMMGELMEEVFVYCFTVCWGFAVPSHLIVDQMISTMKITQTHVWYICAYKVQINVPGYYKYKIPRLTELSKI